MILSAIVAVAENGVIGRNNTLPWRLPDDLKYFRQLTTGHHVVMGRKNYQDIGKPLPHRVNLVLSHHPEFVAPGCQVLTSLDLAIAQAQQAGESECFIIGGAAVYQEALPKCQRLYYTQVHASVPGDVFFPDLGDGWQERSRKFHEADERHAYAFSFVVLERV